MRFIWGILLALAFAQIAAAYSYILNNYQPIKWPAGTIPLQILVDDSHSLSDGSNLATSIQAAAEAWNEQIQGVQFSSNRAGVGSGTALNGINEVFFTSAPYSSTWGPDTLAVTVSWFTASNQTVESDVMFNPAFNWDSYRCNLQGSTIDIRRVATHELGHVLGLDHPDQNGQTVLAIMNSTISNIDSLQLDDIAGAQSLYGGRADALIHISNTLPSSMEESSTVSFTYTVTNTGTQTWGPNHYLVLRKGNPVNTVQATLNGVAPGQSTTVNFTFTAGSAGFDVYDVQAMDNGIYFGADVYLNFTVVAPNDAIAFLTGNFPTFTYVDTTLSFTYNVSDVGSLPWDSSYYMDFKDSNHAVLASTSLSGVGQGGTKTVGFGFTAQRPHGTYTYYMQARKTGLGYFGAEITLTVTVYSGAGGPPSVSNPSGISVIAGSSAQFTVTANGSPTPTMQWQRLAVGSSTWSDLSNTGSYTGVTTATLNVSSTTAGMNGDEFRSVATN